MLCRLSLPAARQEKNIRLREHIFVSRQAGSRAYSDVPLLHLPSLYVEACECLRMQGQRSEPDPARASKVLQASDRRKAKSIFSDRKCLYGASDRGFVQLLRGNFLVG